MAFFEETMRLGVAQHYNEGYSPRNGSNPVIQWVQSRGWSRLRVEHHGQEQFAMISFVSCLGVGVF